MNTATPRRDQLELCASAYLAHKETIERAVQESLSHDPNREIAVIFIHLVEDGVDHSTIVVADRTGVGFLATQHWVTDELTKIFCEELSQLFVPTTMPDTERMLFMDLGTRLVCRYRFHCDVRARFRTSRHLN